MSNAMDATPALSLRRRARSKLALKTILACLVVGGAVCLLLPGRELHQPAEEEVLLANFGTRKAESIPSDLFSRPNWWFFDEDGRDTTRIYGPYKRAQIGGLGYTRISCWPSSGGIWSTELEPVDLEFLGLDRFKDTPKTKNPDEEDEFCDKLRKFGPSWHENEAWYTYDIVGYDGLLGFPLEPPPRRERGPRVFYGYPSTGGLWVFKLVHEKEEARIGIGKFSNVLNMDERSKVIEMFGGTFYSDPEKYWKEKQVMPENREKQLSTRGKELGHGHAEQVLR